MNFGFVSTRFAGNDGVSLESSKWAEVLEGAGHRAYWFSGLSDRPAASSFVVPESHFAHPEIEAINGAVWFRDRLAPGTAEAVQSIRTRLVAALREFCEHFAIDVLVPQNAVTIPMNLPLGLAIVDLLRETGMPAIAHHHDFYWERDRFGGRAALPLLEEAFPPRLPRLAHAVIHSRAARDLEERLGLKATVVPNVMDFDRVAEAPRRVRGELLALLGLEEGDRILLQPTRVVPRKGIEHAIELVRRLGGGRHKLLVSHEAGDEGFDYRDRLAGLADAAGVDLRFPSADLTLDEWYSLADFVTFPSLYEGFGNALLEAVHFRKAVLVNRYPVFREDIEPLGFRFVVMDGIVTDEVVAQVQGLLAEPASHAETAERNFRIAAERFGYPLLEGKLRGLMEQIGLAFAANG